jgi:hypothetical protein
VGCLRSLVLFYCVRRGFLDWFNLSFFRVFRIFGFGVFLRYDF